MSPLRQEVLDYIDEIPDVKLEALRPLLRMLVNDEAVVIETDLTNDERAIVLEGRKEYEERPETFVPLRALQ
ncbi:MAG: hypothetical protein LBL86_11580 [Coriobacteriales bacterium]|nr:hypothetical protein [Coriobacteriales bacterium]